MIEKIPFHSSEVPTEHLDKHAKEFLEARGKYQENMDRLRSLIERERQVSDALKTVFGGELEVDNPRSLDKTIFFDQIQVVEGVTTRVGVRIKGALTLSGPRDHASDVVEDIWVPAEAFPDDLNDKDSEFWKEVLSTSLVYESAFGNTAHRTEEPVGFWDQEGHLLNADLSEVGPWDTTTGEYPGDPNEYLNHPMFRLIFRAEEVLGRVA